MSVVKSYGNFQIGKSVVLVQLHKECVIQNITLLMGGKPHFRIQNVAGFEFVELAPERNPLGL